MKYIEVTSKAIKINKDYIRSGYTRIFYCSDVKDTWLVRILPGYDEAYEPCEGKILLERNLIQGHPHLKYILEEDDFSNWDYGEYDSMEEIIEVLDGGFGIYLETE